LPENSKKISFLNSDASRLEHCWSGTIPQNFVELVERRLFLQKPEGVSSAAMSPARRGYTLELTQL